MSPHRVWHMEDADMVFVPAHFGPDQGDPCIDFFANYVPANFPALSTKPHVMVPTSHALSWDNHRCWNHDLFKNFTILTSEPYVSGWQHDFTHCVGVPMMSHLHKQHLMNGIQGDQDPLTISASKHRLVFESFNLRNYPTRFTAHKHCVASPRLCKHVDWKDADNETLLLEVQRGYKESWFTIMPHSDFKLRNSLFDALLAPSIPVVFDMDYASYMPFQMHLNYSKILAVIDESLVVEDGENLSHLIHQGYFSRRLEMIEYIASVRHLLQYRLYPQHSLISFQTRGVTDAEDDAFTLSMKVLLANLCGRNLLDRDRCGQDIESNSEDFLP